MGSLHVRPAVGATILCAACAVAVAATIPRSSPVLDTQGRRTGISVVHMDGRPPAVLPPPNAPPVTTAAAGDVKTISEIPAWTWCYGCANTAAAVIFGHWDRAGYPNMYVGPAAGSPRLFDLRRLVGIPGLCPMNNETAWPDTLPSLTHGESPLAASHMGVEGRATYGYVDDWWYEMGSAIDPCLDAVPPWTPHSDMSCTADFMCTSRADKGCYDGDTLFFYSDMGSKTVDYQLGEPNYRDGGHGMKLFAESRGYQVEEVFNQLIFPTPPGKHNYKGFTFDDYKACIDAGLPVMLMVSDHTFVGYGYNVAGGQELCYIRTMWDNNAGDVHTIPWGGSYSGYVMWMVSAIKLKPALPDPKPDLLIKSAVAPDYIGGAIYNTTGDGQTACAKVPKTNTATFLILLRNQGNVPDSYKLTGPAGNAQWQVTYWDALSGGSNITGNVTGSGWTTSAMNLGAEAGLRVDITPTSSAPANATLTLALTATSQTNPAKLDVVKAQVTRVSADVTNDGLINDQDTRTFVNAWRTAVGGGAVNAMCDLNGDGRITLADAIRYTELLLGRQ